MSNAPRAAVPSLCLALLLAAVAVLIRERPALSFPQAPPASKWEYTTEHVDAGALLVKLQELAGAGWDVFSIEQHTQGIEQAADGKTKLQVERYQITSRRALKP